MAMRAGLQNSGASASPFKVPGPASRRFQIILRLRHRHSRNLKMKHNYRMAWTLMASQPIAPYHRL